MAFGIIVKEGRLRDGSKLKEQISQAYIKEIKSRKYDVNVERERAQDVKRKMKNVS